MTMFFAQNFLANFFFWQTFAQFAQSFAQNVNLYFKRVNVRVITKLYKSKTFRILKNQNFKLCFKLIFGKFIIL